MLKDELKTLLGTEFTFYLKAQGFHWNVEGPDFPQYHAFLGELYQEVYDSIDKIAELIRQLDSYAPGSLARMQELSAIPEQSQIPRRPSGTAQRSRDGRPCDSFAGVE
jgi:starvation-inducible DNA-binding protein